MFCKKKTISRCNKIGRTHMQDATPITFSQELEGFSTQFSNSLKE